MGISLLPKRGEAPPIFGRYLLWANGCMYHDTTWYGGRPQPRRHCVSWGPSSPSPNGTQPPIYCQCPLFQTAGWTKMPLGTEVGLGPGDFVFDGYPAPPKKGTAPHPILVPCLLWPNGWMDQGATWYGVKPRPRLNCLSTVIFHTRCQLNSEQCHTGSDLRNLATILQRHRQKRTGQTTAR